MFVRSSTSRFLLTGAGLVATAACAFLLVADRPEAARRNRESVPVTATSEPAPPALAAEPLAFPLVDASTSVLAPPELATGPQTSEGVLVERVGVLGAGPEAASAATRTLSDSLRLRQPVDVQEVVASLGLPEAEARKAGMLMVAYLGGEPLRLLGLEAGDVVRDRAIELVGRGIDPDVAAWSVQHDDLQRAGEGGFRELDGVPSQAQSPVVTAICKTCPMFDYGVYTPTTTWQTHSGTITAGDCKLYKFTLLANRTYSFSFCEGGGTAAFDTALTLWSSNCTQLAQNDNTCGLLSALSYTNGPATSYVFVRVSSTSGTGAYTLAYRETASTVPTCKTCPNFDVTLQPQTYWQTVNGTIAPGGGCVLYRVPVLVNHNYRFSFCDGGGDANFDTVIETYRGNCMPGPSNDDWCSLLSEVDFFSNTSQYVYVKVRGYGGESGTYTLAYADYATDCVSCGNYNFGTISPTTTPATHSSSLAVGYGCKVYAFNLVAGRTYRFTTCEDGGGAAFNTALSLSDQSCNVQATNDDATGCGTLSRINYTAPYSGVFYLSVSSADGTTGSYTLSHVEICRTCPDFHATLANPTLAFQYYGDSILRNGCRIYKVSLTSGVTYRFSTCPTVGPSSNATFDTRIGVLDSACAVVAANNDGPGVCPPRSIVQYTATATGTYYVYVDGAGTANGSFTLGYRRL